MDPVIDVAAPEDYEAIIECWNRAGLPHRPLGRDSPDNMKRLIAEGSDTVLVVREGGSIVATLVVTGDGRKGWINRLAVIPERRGGGLASALVKRFEEMMLESGHPVVLCVLVEDWNRGSLEFFKKQGYVRDDSVLYLSKRESPDI